MKNRDVKILLSLVMAGACIALLFSISRPSEPENARLFGFSYLRLGLMGADLAMLVMLALVTFKAFQHPRWLENVLQRITRYLEDPPDDSYQQINNTDTSKLSRKRFWYYDVVLILLVMLVFTPIIYSMVFLMPKSDYPSHIYWAEQLIQASQPDVPPSTISHAGWQLLVILIHKVTRCPFSIAGFLATLLSIVLMALVLFHWTIPALQKQRISLWWGVGIAIGLNLVTPVFLAAFLDRRFYFGYLGMITYHNPTIILLRPFAILQFIYAVRSFNETSSAWLQVIIAAFISLLAVFIKPVFAIGILPAIGVIAIYRSLKKQNINWKMLLIGLFLPSLIILVWQFLLTYYSNEGGGIIFSPFGVMRLESDWLLVKFLLSIIFPLSVTVFYFGKARKDIRLVLGWLILFISVFFTYFIAESGKRFMDGNFLWTGEIAMLVLFCISTLFFIEQIRGNRFKVRVLKLCWVLHGISGIIYYIYVLLWKSYN